MKDAQKPISFTLIFIWLLVLTAEEQRRRWMDGSYLPTVLHVQQKVLLLLRAHY